MRLHLPKTLLAAVLAACAALPAGAGVSESAFEINSTETNESESMSGYATFANGKYSSVNTDPTGKTAVTTIRPGDSTTGTIAELNVASDKALNISANGTSNFTDLTISRINVAEAGSATLNIAGAQVVKIGGASGTVNFAVSGPGAGELIFNGRGTYGNYSTSTDNYTRKIQVTNSSIVTFNTITNSWGMGAIDVAAGSELNATSIVLKSGNNNGGDFQGGKITGAGKVSATTLDAGNIGNYTVSVADFEAGTLNAGWETGGKMLTLSSSTLKIGSLNQTNGTVKITSATSAKITSLNISGGIIDASSMEGTLTISGATWTGGLTTDSVEVVKAKDASAATSLAADMDSTHGLNYRFSADGSSVYRTLRTEYYRNLTATTNASDSSRIVIGSIAYDGKTFTNVALKDLLAGDKVTLGTAADEAAGTAAQDLTGWIGYNNDIILADLEFAAGTTTHVNNGNEGGTITYSGAITGSGTLSFDWNKDGVDESTSNTYVFTGDLSGFSGTIQDATTLHVTIGGTPATEAAKEVNATIDIAGVLIVNRDATFTNTVQAGDNIKVTSGVFRVERSASTNKELDLSAGNSSTGCVEIASGASLTVGTNIWGRSNDTFASKILLEKDANLVWSGFTITGKTAKDGVETGLRFGVNDTKLASDNSAHSVTNSVITSTGTGTKTLGWTLSDTDLVVKSGTLRLGASVNASNVTVSAGSTLELVSGWQQKLSSSNTKWESGATLRYVSTNAVNLDVGTVSGSTIELYGVTGTLNAASSAIKGDIVLTNNGQDAAAKFGTISGTSYTFDGKVKGGGNLLLNESGKTTNLNFNGNLSEWVSGSEDYSGLYVMAGTVNATIGVTEGNTISDNSVANAFNAASGAQLNLTIARDAVLTNKVNITSLAVNAGKTLSLSADNDAVDVGSTTVGAGAKIEIGNKESAGVNLGSVSGSGTISSAKTSQSISLSTDSAKTFTGTLEATAGKLSVTATAQQTLSGLTAKGGNIDVLSTTKLTVSDVVLGDAQTINVYSGADDTSTAGTLSVSGGDAAGITVGQGSTMKANLTLGEGAGMSFNVAGLTGAADEAAICTLTGSLTLGLNVELHLLNLGMLEKGKSITLFTGVTGFTYSDAASVAALSDDDVSTGTVNVDASEIFGNVDSGFFTVKYDGNNVILTASSNVPEPTTATLSLLALMGLAARRRRRKA